MSTKLDNSNPTLSAPTLDPSAIIAKPFDVDALKELGLSAGDMEEVKQMARDIDPTNRTSMIEFGREIGHKSIGYAEAMLSMVRNKDMDSVGQELGKVVLIAKKLDTNALSAGRSRIPVLGPLIDRLKMTRAKFEAEFESSQAQITAVMDRVDSAKGRLVDRVKDAETMFEDVKDEHYLIGKYIAAATIRLDEMRRAADEARAKELTPSEVQNLNDMENAISLLDKRLGDFRVMRHSAFLMMPEIRMYQANNSMLIDKYDTIRELTIPVWKRQFALAISLNEQSNFAELANHIDDATNAFLISNAELLKRNSVSVAKSNQRLVIDITTLDKVQETLISTVTEVIKIQQDGMQERAAQEPRLQTMRADIESRLARRTSVQ